MASRLPELQEIAHAVAQNPKDTTGVMRKRFWSLVRQIKRDPHSTTDEILLAAEIRDMLFRADRGRTVPLIPALTLWFAVGTFLFLPSYLALLRVPLDWSRLPFWAQSDWWVFAKRVGNLMAAVFFYYPFGRLIGGTCTGIKLDGFCRGRFYEPTLKIDYVSFLRASASNRKWLFFFAGTWTILTSLAIGLIGFVLAADLSGILPAMLLALIDCIVILSGTTGYAGGEMAHFNRERMIEREWKRRLNS